MSNLLIVVLALTLAPRSFAQVCAVEWREALNTVVDKGMEFNISRLSGVGECFQHGAAFVISASDKEAVTCDVEPFVGSQIRDGWKVRIVADTALYEAVFRAGHHFPILRLKAPAGITRAFIPRRIEVSNGIRCRNWQDAFIFN